MTDPIPDIPNSVCPRCGARFECGISAGKDQCWCFSLPPKLPATEGSACLCPDCLRAEPGEPGSAGERVA